MESKNNRTEYLKKTVGQVALVPLLLGLTYGNQAYEQQKLFDRLMKKSAKGDVTLIARTDGEYQQFHIAPKQFEIPEGLKNIIARANDRNTPLDITLKTPETSCKLTFRGEELAELERLSTLRRMLTTVDLVSNCAPFTTSASPSAEAFAAYQAPDTPHPVVHDGKRVDTLELPTPTQQL